MINLLDNVKSEPSRTLTDNQSVDNSENNIYADIEKDFNKEAPKPQMPKSQSMKNIYLSRGDIIYSDVDSQDEKSIIDSERSKFSLTKAQIGY